HRTHPRAGTRRRRRRRYGGHAARTHQDRRASTPGRRSPHHLGTRNHAGRTKGEDFMTQDATMDRKPIKRALISVYDKTGLEDLARALHDGGVQIVSTGSTASRIADAGVPVTPVEELTGFPECL